jgi:hypothetical protein
VTDSLLPHIFDGGKPIRRLFPAVRLFIAAMKA